ncbi:MAG TPA: UTP--glucose-1-phosphate uridylyltransferase [Candidatus Micrarchaeia archaeon]|nr:UTP--glucose-1-phosphate uridylyltransferase [Candidatus Micrarchaeia archaeon]
MASIETVVIPAGGLGTRFLPVTKAIPKELIPVGGRPVLQWAVEEARASGIIRTVLVTGPGKEALAAHFARDPRLERALEARGDRALLDEVRAIHALTRIEVVEQPEPLGLGDAVLRAASAVAGEAAVCALLPDDLFIGRVPLLRQLMDAYAEHQCPVVALRRCDAVEIGRYGVAAISGPGPVFRVTDLVEKPPPGEAPSDLALMGRYVLTPAVFAALERTPPGALGEVQLTDGIRGALADGPVVGVEYTGRLLDVGTLEGWVRTLVELLPLDPRLGPVFRAALAATPPGAPAT